MVFALLIGCALPGCRAENPPNVALESSETLFTVLTAMNACGYDAGLSVSDPLRLQIREEVAKATQNFDQAKEEAGILCQFYHEHEQPDPALTLAQYVSLALCLQPPPTFAFKMKEADLPPDASKVAGIVPILQKFYDVAGLHGIWQRHEAAYGALATRYHEPLSKVVFDTEIYLKLPSAGYLGHTFTVFVDPMGAPGETNARNYGADYSILISPGNGSNLKIEQIRHAYLHYLLDPLALKYPAAMQRLKPLLTSTAKAPMDQSFKNDVSLLVTECLIRAIEARIDSGKAPEAQRQAAVQRSEEQGYILTAHFYDALGQFEKGPTGLRNAYQGMVEGIDVGKEQRRAAQIQFASQADPELVRPSQPAGGKLVTAAEQKLAAGDADGARQLAQQALESKDEDHGRALFLLAQIATKNRDIEGARNYFQQTLSATQEPKVLAWSHIYLGRIFDLQENREAALDQYRAALGIGSTLPEAKAAAERGIQQPYEPPSAPH